MGPPDTSRPRAPVALLLSILLVPLWALAGEPDAGASTPPTPVVLILFENHGYYQIVGNPQAPYINETFIPSGLLMTDYYAVAHPSLPNYLALTSGSTDGCSTDTCAPGFTQSNLFAQLGSAHLSWASYEESMPSNCYRTNTTLYFRQHNPAAYYSDIYPDPCQQFDVPFPSSLPTTLPEFSLVTPNVCHDMHSCSVSLGDEWLADNVPAFLSRGAIVILTFDEGINDYGGGGHVMCAEVGPGIARGTTNTTFHDHYGLLAGIENHFGLGLLQEAAKHTPVPV